jgi:hypothetical protein
MPKPTVDSVMPALARLAMIRWISSMLVGPALVSPSVHTITREVTPGPAPYALHVDRAASGGQRRLLGIGHGIAAHSGAEDRWRSDTFCLLANIASQARRTAAPKLPGDRFCARMIPTTGSSICTFSEGTNEQFSG